MNSTRAYPSAHQVVVKAERDVVFTFLAELPNHWRLLGETVERFEPRLDGAGAVLHMRAAPLPIRRRVETEIVAIDEPVQIRGVARSRQTTATIIWRLESHGDQSTRVTLTVRACPVGIVDKLIVRLGGPWWRGRYRQALRKLSAHFGQEGTPEDCAVEIDFSSSELGESAPA